MSLELSNVVCIASKQFVPWELIDVTVLSIMLLEHVRNPNKLVNEHQDVGKRSSKGCKKEIIS